MFKMSSAGYNAGCQSLEPFTDRIVNHFLVHTVPFLDTLAQLFHINDPVVIVHTDCRIAHTAQSMGFRSDCSATMSLIVSGMRAVQCRPLPKQRSTLPVSILLSTVLTPLNVQFLFGNILSIFLLHRASAVLILLTCAYLLLKKAFLCTV